MAILLVYFFYVAVPSFCLHFVLFRLARLSRRLCIVIFSLGILATLIAGHWTTLRNLPVAIESRNWPSTEAKLVRVHIIHYLGIRRGRDMVALDMPYLYSVNGRNYRGTRYNAEGNLAGEIGNVRALTADPSKVFRAYYNPARPGDAVLVPGFAPTSFNLHTILPMCIFGFMLLHSVRRPRPANQSQSTSPTPPASRSTGLKVVVGAMLFVFVADIEFWLIGREAHGLNANYCVLQEAPLADGIEYWIATGPLWHPWQQSPVKGWLWMHDSRDTQFIAADGSLKEIKRRKWNIYCVNMPTGSKGIPRRLKLDWIMTWSAEDGIHTEPVSGEAKRKERVYKQGSN